MSTKTVNISFKDSLLADIDRVAREESRSRSELLREAARMYIERKKRWEQIFAYGEARAAEHSLSAADIHSELADYRKQKRND